MHALTACVITRTIVALVTMLDACTDHYDKVWGGIGRSFVNLNSSVRPFRCTDRERSHARTAPRAQVEHIDIARLRVASLCQHTVFRSPAYIV
jgi:hypothetical protein